MNGGLLSAGTNPERISETAENKIHALLITSSGLYCALNDSEDRSLHKKTIITSIYHPAASVWSFNDIQRALTNSTPDIIIVQGSLLANNRKMPYKSVMLQHLKRYWFTQLSQFHPLIHNSLVKLQCTFDSLDPDRWAPKLKKSIADKTQQQVNLPEQVAFLKTLINQNKPVIIVNQPYPSAANSYLKTVTQSVDQIVRDAGATDSVIRVMSTSEYPDTFFYDPFHPTPRLSKAFTGWFHFEIDRLLEK